MLNFFDSIYDFFYSIWQMIINFTTGLVNAIVIVTSATTLPVQLVSYVPSFISASIFLVLGIGVVKLILGWGNS